jgi:hypothetical protein
LSPKREHFYVFWIVEKLLTSSPLLLASKMLLLAAHHAANLLRSRVHLACPLATTLLRSRARGVAPTRDAGTKKAPRAETRGAVDQLVARTVASRRIGNPLLLGRDLRHRDGGLVALGGSGSLFAGL